MANCGDDYRIEIEKRIDEMSDQPEYKVTGQKLVTRIHGRLKLLGADKIPDSYSSKSIVIDSKTVSSRYKTRMPRANYGKLSTEIPGL